MTKPLSKTQSTDSKMGCKQFSPDTGWAWMISIAGMVNTMIGVGLYRSMAVLMIQLMEVFDEPAAKFSLIFSSVALGFTLCAVLYILGIGEIFHERILVMAAGLIGSLAFILTYFSTRIEHFYISGFLVGVTSQIGLSSSLGLVGKYFHKKISIGNGIVMSGVSLGTLALPPAVQFLYDEYTYRGAGIIVAGFVLNTFVTGFLMRPVRTNQQISTDGQSMMLPQIKQVDSSQPFHEEMHNAISLEVINIATSMADNSDLAHDVQASSMRHNVDSVESCHTCRKVVTDQHEIKHKKTLNDNHENHNSMAAVDDSKIESDEHRTSLESVKTNADRSNHVVGETNPAFVEDNDECVSNTQLMQLQTGHKLEKRPDHFLSTLKNLVFLKRKHPPRNISTVRTLLGGLVFFKSVSFNLFQIFSLCSTLGGECLLQFYPVFITDIWMTSYPTAYFLSFIGGSDLASRILIGYLGDYVNRDVLVIVPQMILAVVCFVLPITMEFWSQVILSVVVGLNYGVTDTFKAVLLIDLFGCENLSRTLGVSNFIGGFGFMFGSPLVGYLRDVTGSYETSIQVLGSMFVASFVSLCLLTLIRVCRHQKERSSDVQ